MKLFNADNREVLKELADNSVDSVITDPPYGLSFMNKKWDYDVPSIEFWREVYRVLKPGGHILSFGGTRTYHRLVVAIEDAGFEIRDQIMWIYGSGFPKSLNIGKAVDKRGGESIGWFGEWLIKWRKENNIPQSKVAELFPSKTGGLTGCVSNWELGNNLPTNDQFNLICRTFNLPFNSLEEAEREFIGTKTSGIGKAFTKEGWGSGNDEVEITKGSSEYEGWGSALKPAVEPIVLARKPLSEKSIAENVMKWRTGGLNIDGCRIGYEAGSHPKDLYGESYMKSGHGKANNDLQNISGKERSGVYVNDTGRFPANVILECCCDESDIHTNPDCPCYIMDEQSGVSKTTPNENYKWNNTDCEGNTFASRGKYTPRSDKGGASRFYYRAKVSKKERNLGLDGFEENEVVRQGLAGEKNNPIHKNNHPTLKPINLLTYLCRLITPPNGVVLDPFMGSGSTGVAALLEGFDFIGMELEKDYFDIAEQRIKNYELYKKILK